MRVASRVIGVVLALAGLCFLAASLLPLFIRESVLVESSAWKIGAFAAIFGIGFILLGWYYFKLDVDALDETQDRPASRFAPFFLAHRSELKIVAVAGLVVSLIRLGAACFGVHWPGHWAGGAPGALLLAGIGLAAIQGQISKPQTGIPRTAEKLVGTAFLILGLLWSGAHLSHRQFLSRVTQAGLIVLLFAWEAVFFTCGAIKTDENVALAP